MGHEIFSPVPPQGWSFVLAWQLDPLALRFARNQSRSSPPGPLAAHQHGINASQLLKTAFLCGARWRFMRVGQKKLTSARGYLWSRALQCTAGSHCDSSTFPDLILAISRPENSSLLQSWYFWSKLGPFRNKKWLETATGMADRVLSGNWNSRGERGHNVPVRWASRSRNLCVSTVFSNFPTGVGVCSLGPARHGWIPYMKPYHISASLESCFAAGQIWQRMGSTEMALLRLLQGM